MDQDVLRAGRRLIRPRTDTRRWRWRWGRVPDGGVEGLNRTHRRWTSLQLHRLGAVASHAWAGALVALVALGWVAYGALGDFPSYWQTILESVTSVVTVIMLFAIQHLQARDQVVTHRKLDEILRAMPQADNRLIAVEEAPDQELEILTDLNRQDRLNTTPSDPNQTSRDPPRK